VDQGQQARAALGRAPVLSPKIVERALASAGATACFLFGYFAVGLHTDVLRSHALTTTLDARIPFLASSIWIYLGVFPASLLPLFVVRSQRLFRRTIAAYVAAIAVSCALFAAWPVTSVGLRVDSAALDTTRFSPWAVARLYRLDPPANLFPSLHLSIALLAALSAWKARRTYGAVAFAAVAVIGISTCTVKQHFVLDAAGGVALAVLIHALVLRGYEPSPGENPAYGWRGPASFAGLLAAAYTAAFGAFLAST